MHADLDLYKNKVVLYGDVNMLTDRQANNVVSPSELDWIVGLAVHWRDMEFAVYHEQDRPLDRGGLVQQYFALQLRFSFDISKQDLRIGNPLCCRLNEVGMNGRHVPIGTVSTAVDRSCRDSLSGGRRPSGNCAVDDQ